MRRPDLDITIGVSHKKASEELKNFYATARRIREEAERGEKSQRVASARELATIAKLRVSVDETRLKSAQRVAAQEARTEQQIQKSIRETERVRTEATRRQIMLSREAERQIERQARAERQANRPGGFAQAVLSSRFSLPGTNGNIMPLVGQSLKGGVGGFLGTAGMAVASGLSEAARQGVSLASDLEEAMNLLRAQSGATEHQLELLRQKATELGSDLSLPATSSLDAARALQELSRKGLDVEASMQGARGSILLAAAANKDAAEAAGFAASMLNAFELKATETDRIASVLTKTMLASGATFDDLTQGFAQAASTYHQAGFTIEDLAADMAAMEKAGIRGSDAGTSLKTAVQALISPSETASKTLKALSVNVYDQSGRLKDHRQIIGELSRSLVSATEEERNFALRTIFGTDAIRAANTVFAAGTDKLDKMTTSINKAADAQKLADARTQGLKGSIDGLRSASETFLEQTATPFLNFFTSLVKGASAGIDKLGELRAEIAKGRQEFVDLTAFAFKATAPTGVNDARTKAGTLMVYERVLREEYRTTNRNRPATELPKGLGFEKDAGPQLLNAFEGGQRNVIIGTLQRDFGLPRYPTPPQIEATLRKVIGMRVLYEESAKLAAANKITAPTAPPPVAGGGGGGGGNSALADLMKGGGKSGRTKQDTAAERARRQAAGARTESAARGVRNLKNEFDTVMAELNGMYGPNNRAALVQRLVQLSQQIAIAEEFEAEAQMEENGGPGNPEAREKFRSALEEINNDASARIKEVTRVNNDQARAYVEGQAESQRQEKEKRQQRVKDAHQALRTFGQTAGQMFRSNLQQWQDMAETDRAGADMTGGVVAGSQEAMSDAQRQAVAQASLLYDAAKTGKQSDLAKAFDVFDASRFGPEGISGMRDELGSIASAASQPGSRLLSREAAPFMLRRLEQIRSDATAARSVGMQGIDDEFLRQIDEAIAKWKEGMKSSAELFGERAVDTLGNSLGNLTINLLEGRGAGGFGRDLIGGIGRDIAGEMSERFSRSARSHLKDIFAEAKDGFGSLFKGAEMSAGRIALTGFGLLSAIEAVASGRGSGGSLFGGILGGIAGFALGGPGGALTGFSVGANLGGGNYAGAIAAGIGYAGMRGGGGRPGDLSYTYNNGSVAVGKSRAAGGAQIILNRYHYGDNYDRIDRDRDDQALVSDLQGVLSRI